MDFLDVDWRALDATSTHAGWHAGWLARIADVRWSRRASWRHAVSCRNDTVSALLASAYLEILAKQTPTSVPLL